MHGVWLCCPVCRLSAKRRSWPSCLVLRRAAMRGELAMRMFTVPFFASAAEELELELGRGVFREGNGSFKSLRRRRVGLDLAYGYL
jgi:hypothetical protein